MQVVVTGASGFIGQHLAGDLAKAGHQLLLLGGNRVPTVPSGNHRAIALGAIEECNDLSSVIQSAECVIHLAGRAHVLRETQADPETQFRNTNVLAVRKLLEAMKLANIQRLILMSSIAAKNPINAYGRSKLAGEMEALNLGRVLGIDVVSLRPPLVYGPNAPGNLSRLLSLINTGLPLPFGSINNRRSLCSVQNLTDLLVQILSRPSRTGIYEVCDNEIVSLREIVIALSEGANRKIGLLQFPQLLLRRLAALFSKSLAEGLFGDLTLDNSALLRDFGWQPKENTLSALKNVARINK